jgi:hypothetical protein
MKKTIFLTIALFIALSGALPGFAQEAKTIKAAKSGKFQIGKPIRLGNKWLKPGRYQVQHFIEGTDNTIVFKEVKLGFRNNFGEQILGAEVARVTSKTISTDKRIAHTKFVAGKDRAGERIIIEIWIKGETVKHLLLN